MSLSEQNSLWPGSQLADEWNRAQTGDVPQQSQWGIRQGGQWEWQSDALVVRNNGTEWASAGWNRCGAATLRELRNFKIEVTISGKAEAAGLSFGDFKDFLVDVSEQTGARHIQLEIDAAAGCWAFCVDGKLQQRCWWDSSVRGVDDLVNGTLFLKTRRAEQVFFRDLAIHTFEASCRLSVIMTCHRFLQRLRLSLRNWCHQNMPTGSFEVLVVNPDSPDGTHEHLSAVARSFPHVRIREVVVDSGLATNKGAMINCAIEASRGSWIWLTDADCLFSPTCAADTLKQIDGRSSHVFYGQRRFLTASHTDALLAGRLDGLSDFAQLSRFSSLRAPENAPWGYTQIVDRSVVKRVSYPRGFNHFAHSDGYFVEACKRHRVTPQQVSGLFCLHLEHPFAWYGTKTFL